MPVNCHLRAILTFLLYCCDCIKSQCISIQYLSSNLYIELCRSSNKFYKCTYVHLCLFHSKRIQYSTWCQNRGCSYISSTRRIYRSNPAVSCIFPSILKYFYKFYSRITVLLKVPRREEDKRDSAKCHWIQGLQSSSTGRNSILSGSRLSRLPAQVPREAPHAVPRASKHSTQQKLHSMWQRHPADPCGVPLVAVEEEFLYF